MCITSDKLDSIEKVFAISQSVNLPWSMAQYKENMALDYTHYIVSDYGFVGCTIICQEAEITNIAVKKEYQRKGYASFLMTQLKQFFEQQHVTLCFLEVRESNQAARLFYEREQFVAVGKRKNYYNHPVEHAIIYKWEKK